MTLRSPRSPCVTRPQKDSPQPRPGTSFPATGWGLFCVLVRFRLADRLTEFTHALRVPLRATTKAGGYQRLYALSARLYRDHHPGSRASATVHLGSLVHAGIGLRGTARAAQPQSRKVTRSYTLEVATNTASGTEAPADLMSCGGLAYARSRSTPIEGPSGCYRRGLRYVYDECYGDR